MTFRPRLLCRRKAESGFKLPDPNRLTTDFLCFRRKSAIGDVRPIRIAILCRQKLLLAISTMFSERGFVNQQSYSMD